MIFKHLNIKDDKLCLNEMLEAGHRTAYKKIDKKQDAWLKIFNKYKHFCWDIYNQRKDIKNNNKLFRFKVQQDKSQEAQDGGKDDMVHIEWEIYGNVGNIMMRHLKFLCFYSKDLFPRL